MRSTNPCGYAHPKNQPCRLCDAELARRRRAEQSSEPTDKARAREVPEDVGRTSADTNRSHPAKPRPEEPSRGGQRVVESPKTERLETAKKALTVAERQRKFREKDPEAYKAWNRARMRARRKK